MLINAHYTLIIIVIPSWSHGSRTNVPCTIYYSENDQLSPRTPGIRIIIYNKV